MVLDGPCERVRLPPPPARVPTHRLRTTCLEGLHLQRKTGMLRMLAGRWPDSRQTGQRGSTLLGREKDRESSGVERDFRHLSGRQTAARAQCCLLCM